MAEMDDEQHFSRETDEDDPILERLSNAVVEEHSGPAQTQPIEEIKASNEENSKADYLPAYGQILDQNAVQTTKHETPMIQRV